MRFRFLVEAADEVAEQFELYCWLARLSSLPSCLGLSPTSWQRVESTRIAPRTENFSKARSSATATSSNSYSSCSSFWLPVWCYLGCGPGLQNRRSKIFVNHRCAVQILLPGATAAAQERLRKPTAGWTGSMVGLVRNFRGSLGVRRGYRGPHS